MSIEEREITIIKEIVELSEEDNKRLEELKKQLNKLEVEREILIREIEEIISRNRKFVEEKQRIKVYRIVCPKCSRNIYLSPPKRSGIRVRCPCGEIITL